MSGNALALVAIVAIAIVGLANGQSTGVTVTRCRHYSFPSFVRRYFEQRRLDRQERAEQHRQIIELEQRLELQIRINGEYRRTNSRSVDALIALAEDINRRVGGLEEREQQATTIVVHQTQVIERSVERRAIVPLVIAFATLGAVAALDGIMLVPAGTFMVLGQNVVISETIHHPILVTLFVLFCGVASGGIASRLFTRRVPNENIVRNVEVEGS